MSLTKINNVYSVQMDCILCSMEFNCRVQITNESVVELAQSIEVNGLQTPIHIHKHTGNHKYKIVSGHRRYRACQLLGRIHIDAIILENLNEQHARILNLSENLDRRDLTPYEEAMALVRIFPTNTTLKKMSRILNRSREWCRRRKLIAELPEDICIGFYNGTLGIRDIVALSTLPKNKREGVARQLLKQRENNSKRDLLMGIVTQQRSHRGTKEIRKMVQYLACKKMNGLVHSVLMWTLGYGSSLDIKALTRKAEKDNTKALYK